jgi:hypothetical protein
MQPCGFSPRKCDAKKEVRRGATRELSRNNIPARVYLGYMETETRKTPRGLQPGQMWRIEHGYVYIVELGDRLIHYRMLKDPEQRAALTRLIAIEALATFLWKSEAVLMA